MSDQVKRNSSKRSTLAPPEPHAASRPSKRPKSIVQVPKIYKIHILGTDLANDDKKPYTVYKIEVQRDVDAWVIYRRYRQFHALYTELKSAFGSEMKACGDFPPKQILRNLSPHSVDRRHQRLQDWLKAVCSNSKLEAHPKVQLFIQQGKQDADFVPRQRSDLIESDIEVAGHLFMLKKGHWKRRWLVLRHGLLYKYMNPKEKHPYGFYDLREARASTLDLQRLGDTAGNKRATITENRSVRESGIATHSFNIEIFEKGGKTKKTLVLAAQTEEVLLKWVARINKDKNFKDEDAEFRKLFGVPLNQVRDRDSHGVPLFLSALLNYLQATALDDVELFTRPPDEEIKRTIDRGGLTDLAQLARDVHKVAGLVLQYLQELPDDLIPLDLQDCFYAMFKIEDPTKRHQLIMALADVLPRVNRAILVKLFSFLHAAAFGAAETNDGLALPRLSKIFGRLIFRPRTQADGSGIALSPETIINIVSEMISYPGLLVEDVRQTEEEDYDTTEDYSAEEIEPAPQPKKKSTKRRKSGRKKSKDKKNKSKKHRVEVSQPAEPTSKETGDTSANKTEVKVAVVDSAAEVKQQAPEATPAADAPVEESSESEESEEDEEDNNDNEDNATDQSESESDSHTPREPPSRPSAPPSVVLRARAASTRETVDSTPKPGSESSSETVPTSQAAPAAAEQSDSTGLINLSSLSPEKRAAVEEILSGGSGVAPSSLLISATRNRPKPMRSTRVTSSSIKPPRGAATLTEDNREPAPAPLTPKEQLLLDLNRVLRSSSAPARPK